MKPFSNGMRVEMPGNPDANSAMVAMPFEVALRPSILDPAVPIPDWIHVLYWLHPHRSVEVVRDIGMPAARGHLWGSPVALFSILKFYPIGFIVTDASTYEGLPSLDEFRAAPVDFETHIKLPVDIIFPSDWPNNITADGNMIMAVDTYRDAVRAVPVPPGQCVKRR